MRVSFPDLPDFAVDLDDEGAIGGVHFDREDIGGVDDVNIGREVLALVRLTVDGPAGTYTLEAEPAPAASHPATHPRTAGALVLPADLP